MINPNTGLHEVRKFFKSTNQEFIGTGTTKEAARADLKRQLDNLRFKFSAQQIAANPQLASMNHYIVPREETGETIRSPGWEAVEFKGGGAGYRFNPNREVKVYARPELAAHIRKEREKAKNEVPQD